MSETFEVGTTIEVMLRHPLCATKTEDGWDVDVEDGFVEQMTDEEFDFMYVQAPNTGQVSMFEVTT